LKSGVKLALTNKVGKDWWPNEKDSTVGIDLLALLQKNIYLKKVV